MLETRPAFRALLVGLGISVLSLPLVAQAKPEPALLEQIAHSKEWHRLIHYRRAFPFYRLRSELDGHGFFFSPEGDRNPKAELEATLDALLNRSQERFGVLKQTPNCAFPARLEFLKRRLGITVPEPPCESLEKFLKNFNPHSMTLVFSSAYPSNPGSMFGHTFLRINSKAGEGDRKRRDLLDYGLSYAAAVAEDENPALFILFGLTGGYQGRFSMEPYYNKVNEYNNGESRDLWEYDLSLSEKETRTVLLHAWEIETNSAFNYFFFDENCAYELLTLLEVARPDWDISQFRIYVIPSETIKRLADLPGAITQVRFRPSLRRKMLRRFDALSPASQAQALAVYEEKLDPENIEDPAVLDAAISYFYYTQKELAGRFPDRKKPLLTQMLVRRSQLPITEKSDEVDASLDTFSQPESGHFPFQLGIQSGQQQRAGRQLDARFLDLRFKFAYHDLLNSDVGYIPYSQIDFPGFVLRRDLDRDRFRLEEIHLLSLTSLSPFGFVEKRPSWHFHTYSRAPLDRSCLNCKALHLEGGIGASVQPLGRRWNLYGFVTPAIEFSGIFENGRRFIPHFELSSIITPVDSWKIQLSARHYRDLFQDSRPLHFNLFEVSQSFAANRSFDLRAFGRVVLPASSASVREYGLNLNHYFQ